MHDDDKIFKLILLFYLFNQDLYFRFGVVCTFVSNEYLEDGVKELPSNIKRSLNDTRLYINNTKKVRNNQLFTKIFKREI